MIIQKLNFLRKGGMLTTPRYTYEYTNTGREAKFGPLTIGPIIHLVGPLWPNQQALSPRHWVSML